MQLFLAFFRRALFKNALLWIFVDDRIQCQVFDAVCAEKKLCEQSCHIYDLSDLFSSQVILCMLVNALLKCQQIKSLI